MLGKPVSIIILALLVVSALALAFSIQPVKSDYAWTTTIYINADGSISPPTAPIFSVDNVTYTLTDNIAGNVTANSSVITIQRDNIIVDGAAYTLQGINASDSQGINLTGRSNVRIQNMKITAFFYGIRLGSSSNNNISGNNIIANNGYGVYLYGSSNNNSLSGNNIIANNGYGVYLGASNNSVSGNTVANSAYGIYLGLSNNNSVSGNTVANSGYGIELDSSSNNTIYHDDFINNTLQGYSSGGSTNIWDGGYPSGGNFWSNYNGTDLYAGPYQNETGSDGIGDIHYVIDANNTDYYPLMGPFGSATAAGLNVTVFPSDDLGLIFQNVTVAGLTTVDEMLTYAPALTNLTGEYYDVRVSANYSGNITVRLIFDGSNMTQLQKSRLQLKEYSPLTGDITGSSGVPDGKVDIRDIALIAKAFGSTPGMPSWNPICDLNNDGKIDIKDIAKAAKNFGLTSSWVNITSSVDTTDNVIYGITTHFSVIGIHQE